MRHKLMAAAVVAAAAITGLSAPASARTSFSVSIGTGYPEYYQSYDPYGGYYNQYDGYRQERYEALIAQQRWEQRRRWEERRQWQERQRWNDQRGYRYDHHAWNYRSHDDDDD